ncbi:MAG: FitA-like ribbon-helix-helix domain-containing protein [Reyranella sp.]
MPKTIQIRNVPDVLRRKLKRRAAQAGLSLSDYMLRELREVAARPTPEEMRKRLEQRSAVKLSISTVRAVRAERGR